MMKTSRVKRLRRWSPALAAGVARRATTRWLRGWPGWIPYAAAAWSLVYGAMGLYWALGGAGFPFGEGDPLSVLSVLDGTRAQTAGPVIAGLGLVGAAVAAVMSRGSGGVLLRTILLAFAWASAAALALVIPDYRPLVAVAYAPIALAGAPFGWPPKDFSDAIPWPVVNQFVCIVGGLLWAGAAAAYGRRSKNAGDDEPQCGGRPDRTASVRAASMESAARWGKWAVGVAMVVPLLYAATRWAWALGIPLGISEQSLREGQQSGLWIAGAALGAIAAGGALLTLGLVQKWGEAFPRWVPFLSGRRVPVWLAVVPASLAAILVTQAGLMYVRLTLDGTLVKEFGNGDGGVTSGQWAALGPETLWPLWGVALGAATLAYYRRRSDGSAR